VRASRPPSSTPKPNLAYRMDPALRLVSPSGGEQAANMLAVADFDLVHAIEDYSGSTWLPTNAVYGKAFHHTRRPLSSRHARPGDPLRPPSGYIAHSALMGWKLSPGFAKPNYCPEVAR
jgi:hypothetical protein